MKNLIKNIKNLFSKQHIFVVILYAIFSFFSTSIWCMEEKFIGEEQNKALLDSRIENQENIFMAIKNNDIGIVKKIISTRPLEINRLVNKEDRKIYEREIVITGGIEKLYFGFTPLLFACISGKIEIFELILQELIKSGYKDFNFSLEVGNTWNGFTPLAIACFMKNFAMVKLLLNAFVELKIKDFNDPIKTDNKYWYGYTPLAISCDVCDIESVRLFLEKLDDTNLNEPLESGHTLLTIACCKNQTNIIKLIVDKLIGLGVNNFNRPIKTKDCWNDFSPLSIACFNGNTEAVKFFATKLKMDDFKEIILTNYEWYGFTPLMIACFKGYTEICKIIVEVLNNDDFNKIQSCSKFRGVGKPSTTPLGVACFQEHIEIVEFLTDKAIELGINFNTFVNSWKNNYPEESLLQALCKDGKMNGAELIIKKLIQSGYKNIDFGNKHLEYQDFSLFIIACIKGHLGVVEFFFKKEKNNINQIVTKDEFNGYTPLGIACDNGKVEVVKYLVEKLIELGYKDFNAPLRSGKDIGWTPLAIACNNGHIEVVKYLVEKGVDFNDPLKDGSRKGYTPLAIASENGHVEVVKYLVEKLNELGYKNFNAPLTSGEDIGLTPLGIACFWGCVEVVKYLVEKGVDFNCPLKSVSRDGYTPLGIACDNGKLEVVKYLVEKLNELGCKDFNTPLRAGKDIGWTPLALACFGGHVEVAKYLVEKGVNFNVALKSGSKEGFTPLAIACNYGEVEVVKYLVEKLNELGCKDFNVPLTSGKDIGWTPLAVACNKGHVEVVKYLVKKGVNFNVALKSGSREGYTPLAIACNNGHIEVVKYLEEKGVNFNVALKSGSGEGYTPLGIACSIGHVEVVKYLVEKLNELGYKDVSVSLTSGKNIGYTPLSIACSGGHVQVVKYLVEKDKKDINEPMVNNSGFAGYTPLGIACSSGHVEVVKYLVEKLNELGYKDFNAPLKFGFMEGHTPLAIACNNGEVEVVKYLVEKGADFNVPLKSGLIAGWPPLAIACNNGKVEVVKYLIGKSIELGRKDFNAPFTFGGHKNLTLLTIARKEGHFEIVKIIEEALNSKKAADNKEVCKKNTESEENILEDKTLTCKKIMGKSDLFKKSILKNCKNNKKDLIDRFFKILENNNDRIGLFVNGIKDDEGNTPLSLACRNSNWALVQELLKYSNVDTLNTFNNENKSCLYYACENIASNEIIEKLATLETVTLSNDNPELHPILIALKLYNVNKDNSNGEILSNIIHSLIARNENLDCLFNERMTLDQLKAANPIKSLILLACEFDNVKKEGFLKFLISIEEKKGFEKILSTLISRFIYRSFYEVKTKSKESIFKTDLIAFLNEMKKAKELGSKSKLLKELATKKVYSIIKEFNESKKLKLDFSVMCDDKCACCILKPRNWDAELCMLKCCHIFHKKCIDEWIEISKNKDCPNCRAKIEIV